MKPEYRMRFKTGFSEPIKYTPIALCAGDVKHKLALHRDTRGEWIIAHPESGTKVLEVHGYFEKLPTLNMSSRDMALAEARKAAEAQFNAIIRRVGADKVNSVIEKAPRS